MTKQEKLILSVLLGWFLIHSIILYTVSETPDMCHNMHAKGNFWPLDGGIIKCVYDSSEFLVYAVVPLLIFGVYKFLTVKKNGSPK